MKNISLWKPNGDPFKHYPNIVTYTVEGGVLSFRWERTPKDQSTTERVVTSLPFFVDDDLIS